MISPTSKRHFIGLPKPPAYLRQICVFTVTPLILVAVLSKTAVAATLNRSVVVFFTGFGEDPTRAETGLNQLNAKLQEKFGSAPERPFNTALFTYAQPLEAFSYIQSFNDIGSLGFIGYSLGGNSAVGLASSLLQSTPIDLLVQVDSVGFLDDAKPANVSRGVNYYQSNPSSPGSSFLGRLQEAAITNLVQKNVESAKNINVETLFNDQTITHLNIDNNVRLHELIAINVEESLFRPLNPVEIPATEALITDNSPSLELTGATITSAFVESSQGATVEQSQTARNPQVSFFDPPGLSSEPFDTLALDVQTEAETTPEPATVLGLLGFGIFGASSLLQRRSQQKTERSL